MDTTLIVRIAAGILAVIVLAVIVFRKNRTA
jgi:hypothetical protein